MAAVSTDPPATAVATEEASVRRITDGRNLYDDIVAHLAEKRRDLKVHVTNVVDYAFVHSFANEDAVDKSREIGATAMRRFQVGFSCEVRISAEVEIELGREEAMRIAFDRRFMNTTETILGGLADAKSYKLDVHSTRNPCGNDDFHFTVWYA